MATRIFFIGCLVLMLLGVKTLYSQITIDGIISSVGMDSEPVENAKIEFINTDDTTRVFSATSDEQGQYTVQISSTDIDDEHKKQPASIQLFQNYPNPFHPSTRIVYQLIKPTHIRIYIHNILGQKIVTLYDGFQNNQLSHISWDGRDNLGGRVAAGIYFCTMISESGDFSQIKLVCLDKPVSTKGGQFHPSGIMTNSRYDVNMQPMSDQYRVRITGTNIEPYTKELSITTTMTKNFAVYKTLSDIDGNSYRIVKIGQQWWLAENYKATHFQNNDQIVMVTDSCEWHNTVSSATCVYDNDIQNAEIYGLLYNWYAVNDTRQLAPQGWHVATDNDWQQLEIYLGMASSEAENTGWRGTDQSHKLRTTGIEYWKAPNDYATNESWFSALPGGYRDYFNGQYKNLGKAADFWTATEYSNTLAWHHFFYYYRGEIHRDMNNKRHGFSVRLVKD